jgi:chromate transporter
MILLSLFISFFLIGIGAYGGGMVAISLIYHEIVAVHSWLTFEQMKEVITLAQMTPGPIAINAATFIGYRLGGLAGAALATFAVICPSLLILFLAGLFINSVFFHKHVASKIDFKRLTRALEPGILALLLYAVWTFGRSALTGWFPAVLAAVSLVLIFLFKKINPIFVVLLAGMVSILVYA